MPLATRRKKAHTLKPTASKKSGSTLETDALEAFLEDLEVDINTRCQLLEFRATNTADAIRNAFMIELTKIPKRIRDMNAREFCDQYEGDINVVVEHDRRKVIESTTNACNSTRKVQQHANRTVTGLGRSTRRTGTVMRPVRAGGNSRLGVSGTLRKGVLERVAMSGMVPTGVGLGVQATPARGGDPTAVPATPGFEPGTARRPKFGEAFLSVNGSPVVVLDDGVEAEDGEEDSEVNETGRLLASSLGISPDLLNLSNPGAADKLMEDNSLEYVQQLKALKDQVSSLLEKINPQGN